MNDNTWQKNALKKQKSYRFFLDNCNKKKVIALLPEIHDKVSKSVNCLSCAVCCKNYSPRFKTPDIKRISKYLGKKESDFIETFLTVDTEGDFVLKQMPCNFLQSDNKCSIYDIRPSDCKRFPYSDEDTFVKRKQITIKNSTFCPIAYQVLELIIQKTKTD